MIVTGLNGTTGAPDASPIAAEVGKESIIHANVFVPNGTLRFGKASRLTGAFVGKWVWVEKATTIALEGGFGLGALQPDDLVHARAAHTATPLQNGKVLITGGLGNTGVRSDAELFDPATLSSTLLTSVMTTARADHTATLLPQTETLVVAGQDDMGLLATCGNAYNGRSEFPQGFLPRYKYFEQGTVRRRYSTGVC